MRPSRNTSIHRLEQWGLQIRRQIEQTSDGINLKSMEIYLVQPVYSGLEEAYKRAISIDNLCFYQLV